MGLSYSTNFLQIISLIQIIAKPVSEILVLKNFRKGDQKSREGEREGKVRPPRFAN